MSMSTSQELIYYSSRFAAAPNDFTDDAVMSAQQRKDFLTHYAAHLEQAYALSEKPQKVVEPTAAEMALPRLDAVACEPRYSCELRFDTMQASLQPVVGNYRHWSLYTQKVTVENGALLFLRDDLPPTPAAGYRLENRGRLKRLRFSFYMDSAYAVETFGKVGDVSPGRVVELRCGVRDVVKLGLYANGELVARLGDRCPYHPQNTVVGAFAFDGWQTVELVLHDTTYDVALNGVWVNDLPLSFDGDPDLLFVDCGMFHVGEWQFRPELLEIGDEYVEEFFEKETKTYPQSRPVGEVSLPYAVGGHANRDCALVMEKTFTIDTSFAQAVLAVTSLDPGGRVYLNDELVAEIDGFDSLFPDVTAVLRQGENHLKLVVDPRAPQSLYNWHRQQDNYIGWFCDAVSLRLTNAVSIQNVKADTLSVESGKVRCRLQATVSVPCKLQVYLQPIWPEKGEETRIGAFFAEGAVDRTLTFAADAWTPEAPKVYAIRVEALVDGRPVDDAVIETGFRTIEQKNGELHLNGKRITLTGALTMQLLPPHEETPVTHVCPHSWQVVWQLMMTKAMNGNTLRLHVLGYGNNDRRFARYADRLGVLLIWTTRYVDSVEQMQFQSGWAAEQAYLAQIRPLTNHPSIIMWEGANEYHPTLDDIDRICDAFVPAVKSVDTTRLICPISHLYYAGDFYGTPGCAYYNDAGTADHTGAPATASPYWTDPLVVRSAHPYCILLGYGSAWSDLREQKWSLQPELLQNRQRAYLATEYAIVGRANPHVPEAADYFNSYSYEFPDEKPLGFEITWDDWKLSQAWQALAAYYSTKQLRLQDTDGMLWCCLMSGANDGGYMKPPIDMYGYPKLAFYTLRETFSPLCVMSADVEPLKAPGFEISPVVLGTKAGVRYRVTVTLTDESGNEVDHCDYGDVIGREQRTALPSWQPTITQDGYYCLVYSFSE